MRCTGQQPRFNANDFLIDNTVTTLASLRKANGGLPLLHASISCKWTISHPTNLRKWFNEQKQTALLPADLSDIQAESIETIELDERSAEKVAKLSRRAKAGDEGSAIAKRHIEALAKKHNTTVQKLEEAAAVTSPAAYYCFTPAQIEALKEVRESVMATIPELESDGLSREAIAAVFMNVAKMLLNEARQ